MAQADFKGAFNDVRINLKYIEDKNYISAVDVELTVLEKAAGGFMAGIGKRVGSAVAL